MEQSCTLNCSSLAGYRGCGCAPQIQAWIFLRLLALPDMIPACRNPPLHVDVLPCWLPQANQELSDSNCLLCFGSRMNAGPVWGSGLLKSDFYKCHLSSMENRDTSEKSLGCFICWHRLYDVNTRTDGLLVAGAKKGHQGLAKLQRSQSRLENQSACWKMPGVLKVSLQVTGSHQWFSYLSGTLSSVLRVLLHCSVGQPQSLDPSTVLGPWSAMDQTFPVMW